MVTLGTDAHKRSHTIVAADERGRQVGQVTVKATPEGHLRGLRWASQWAQRRWAIEDCRHLSRRLERDLLAAGEQLVRVPPKLMAGVRRGARTRGRSDPIDALAVARAALREIPAGSLDRAVWLDAVAGRLAAHQGVVAEIAGELVARCRALTMRVKELERRLGGLVAPLTPSLLALAGCGGLTAAKLVGETAGVGRFRTRAAFAMHTGTAPVPVWSGNRERHRLNRGGNRQLHTALHRIAVTQLRLDGTGRAYYQHRLAAGDTKTEAIRALRRRVSDEVYRRLQADEHQRHSQPTCQQPAA
jgi:transposase